MTSSAWRLAGGRCCPVGPAPSSNADGGGDPALDRLERGGAHAHGSAIGSLDPSARCKPRPAPLFALWTEPAQLIRWWAPEGYEASVNDLDTRPAPLARHHAADRRRCRGERRFYRIVEPPRRLVFTWLGR